MEDYINIFKILSDKTRIRVLRLLLKANIELCICEIIDSLEVAQYNISKHTRELKIFGLINERKQGRFVFYSISEPKNDFHKKIIETINSIPDEYFIDDFKRFEEIILLKRDERGIYSCKS